MASDNVRPENATQTSRILNRNPDASTDNDLAHSPSDSAPLRAHGSAASGAQSSTNPTTSRPPLKDDVGSHARNALQILVGIRERQIPPLPILIDPRVARGQPMVLRYEGERAYVLTETELAGLSERLVAIAQTASPLRLRSMADMPALLEELREMERTVEELADRAAGFCAPIEEVG